MTDKHCPSCNTFKPLTEYYRAGAYYQARCKPCHNLRRVTYGYKYTKLKTGFKRLPEETQINIIADLTAKIKKKDIAKKYNIAYPSLIRWIRNGQVQIKD